jgi:ApaG protein
LQQWAKGAMGHSIALTEGIRVAVESTFVPERSDPKRNLYFFAYTILIANEGELPARLISRHWMIRDANGRVEHVRGPGVVGKHPYLEPGERFEYTSFCPLPTPIGSMRGSYLMTRDDGTQFEAAIEEFGLEVPEALN